MLSSFGAARAQDPIFPPLEPVPATTLGVATPLDDPSGVAMQHFYAQLVATARGRAQTHIVVFGASHVAGDVFTRVFRHQLKASFGDAGLGFLVPASPWRDYYNRDANISYSAGWDDYWVSRSHSRDDGVYGLAGISFSSSSKHDWAKLETARKSPFGRTASRVEVYYWKQPGGGDFVVTIDGKHLKRVHTKAGTAGPGYLALRVPDEGHVVEIRPRGNGLVTLFGVALDRDVPGVVMDHMGINGARAATQLEWDPRIFADHLAHRKPDLVVLAYGTNAIGDDDDPIDEYERRYDLVVTRVRSLAPKASCLLVGPSDRPVQVETEGTDGGKQLSFLPRPRQAQVIAVQKRVAARYGCAYWDWAKAMGGDLSMVSWVHADDPMGTPDYVHHTRRGYERIGQLFMEALMGPFEALHPEVYGHPGATFQPEH
ncbi:MAG: hypothetical protein KC635_02170 [Myxococcales bacterium]|nr:hypothetical protein [Myxococcales bacterium]MCB9736566.1 hypothetical protein [Deltaproteobacteria bacterium]